MGADADDMQLFNDHMPPLGSDEALMVLKGHLLVEQLLRTYCKKYVFVDVDEPPRVQFFTLYWAVRAACYDESIAWAWRAANQLNSLRNDLAHQLIPRGHDCKMEAFVELVYSHRPMFKRLMPADRLRGDRVALAIYGVYDEISRALDIEVLRHDDQFDGEETQFDVDDFIDGPLSDPS
jgi:hypothetical protein